MSKASACKTAVALLLFSVLNSVYGAGDPAPAVAAPSTADSARYLQLGMLALENNDDHAAVDFLTNALHGPQQPHVMRRIVDALHASLLRTGRSADAEKLLKHARLMPEFQGFSSLLQLMASRGTYHQQQYQKVIDELEKLQLPPEDTLHRSEQLELLGKSYSQLARHAVARKYFIRLYELNGPLPGRLAAQEGILLNSLDLNDTDAANTALKELHKLLAGNKDAKYQTHLQKLQCLTACRNGKAAEIYDKFIGLTKNASTPDALLSRIAILLTDHFLQQKKFDQAAKCSLAALHLAESSFKRTALKILIETMVAAGKLTDAKAYIMKFCKDYPQDPEIYEMVLLSANLSNRMQLNDDAINIYSVLCKNKQVPQNIRFTATLELAKLYQKINQPQLAVDRFKNAIELAGSKAVQSDLEHRLGEYLYQLGRYQEAVTHFSNAGKLGAKRSGLWLAQSYFQLKKYDSADRALKKFTSHGDADLERRAAYLQALVTEKLRSCDMAIASYLNFVKRYPKSPEAPEALFQAGVLAQQSHRYKAYAIFERYAENYPGERAANALYKALNELLATGDYSKSSGILQKLIAGHAESKFAVAGYFSVISYLRRSGDYKQALQQLQDAAARYQSKYPELTPEILYEYALLYDALKDYPKMHSNLEILIKNHAAHKLAAQAFFMLGDMHVRNGNYQQALTAFQQAQERSQGSVLAYACIGRTANTAYALYGKTRQKQYLRQAAECYENLLKIKDLPPEFYFQSLYGLGDCLKDSGDQTGALRCYREVLYRSLLAKREGRFYPVRWCSKSLTAALNLLMPSAGNAATAEDKNAILAAAEQLLQIAGKLELPGEDIKQKQEILQRMQNL